MARDQFFFFFLASLAAWGDLTNFGHLAGSGSDVCKFQVTFLERKLCTFLLPLSPYYGWSLDMVLGHNHADEDNA